jgi:hypothetical protein
MTLVFFGPPTSRGCRPGVLGTVSFLAGAGSTGNSDCSSACTSPGVEVASSLLSATDSPSSSIGIGDPSREVDDRLGARVEDRLGALASEIG